MRTNPLKNLFRRLLGREPGEKESDALDEVYQSLTATDEVLERVVPSASSGPRSIGADGTALIKQFEGCGRKRGNGLMEAYPDPATGSEPWTIGWGTTGKGIERGTVWTQNQCDMRLERDLQRYAAQVASAIGDVPTSQCQFDALVSFHYNTGAIASATLTKKHIDGDHAGAAREFDLWVHAGGKVMKGLVRRRAAEKSLYLRG